MQVALDIAAIAGFIALTLGTALFVAAEFSLTALERSTIEAQAQAGDVRARAVAQAHRTLSFQLSGAQLGITLTTLITGYLAQPVIAGLVAPLLRRAHLSPSAADGISVVFALILATSLSMVFGELVPKNLAIAAPLRTARLTALPQIWFSGAFSSVINLLNGTANWIVRRFGIEPAHELESARSPRELGSLVRTSARKGALDARTAALMDRSLRFGERSAEELMTPRVRVVSLDKTDSVADLLAAAVRTGFSRFPIVDGDLDNTLGLVHFKHAFAVPAERRPHTPLLTLTRPVPNVPSTLDGDEVLERVRGDGMQAALVVDEYGGTAGLITLEDLIEEILGDVRDEHDQQSNDVVPTKHGWSCSGLLRIDEIEAVVGYRAPEGEYETLAGLVLFQLGRIPQAGDQVILPELPEESEDDEQPSTWLAVVEAMDGRRIDRIHLSPYTPEQPAPPLPTPGSPTQSPGDA